MWELLKELPSYPFVVIGALIAVLGTFAAHRYNSKRAAAKSFREGIIDELNGFYPWPGSWSKGFEEELRIAVSRIEILVEKFRHFVPRRKQKAFDSEWAALKTHCLDATWEKFAAYTMYPTMRSSNDRDPKEAFYEKIENLLGYAKET